MLITEASQVLDALLMSSSALSQLARFLARITLLTSLWRLVKKLSLPAEGWYYLGILVFLAGGAMTRQINLLMLLFGMLAGPLLLNLWCVATMLGRVSIRRQAPEAIVAGDPLVVQIEASNNSRFFGVWVVVVEDRVVRQGSVLKSTRFRPSVLLTHIPAGRSRTGTYRGTLLLRGRYVLGPLRMSTRFPFGLIQCTEQLPQTGELLVYPQLGRLTPAWQRLWRQAMQERVPRPSPRRGPVEGEFHGLRPWQAGDSRRWIHWRTTARQGELMVRQFEQPQQRDLALLVDLWEPLRPDASDREAVERAVSFAATLIADLCRTGGSQIVLGVTACPPAVSDPVVLAGWASQAFLQEALAVLATATATDQERRLEDLLESSFQQIAPSLRVVLVTTRPVDEDLSEQVDPADLGFPAGVSTLPEMPSNTPAADLLARAVVVDAGSRRLEDYFVVPQ